MKKPKFVPEFDDIPTPRAKMPELALKERRGNFAEVELGLTQELALAEAARCLSCRRCIGCGLCLAECDREAIVYDQESTTEKLTVDAVIMATGAECFDATRKPNLGYVESLNVVTTAELERMLSPTGPYGGLPLRPGDGTFPHSVAFVQCVGSREEIIGANYCSSSCCDQALKLAQDLTDVLSDARVTIFHRGMRPLSRAGEDLLANAEASDGVELVFAEVTAVSGSGCTEPVSVEYDSGDDPSRAEFDLVVLSVGQRSPSSSRSVSRLLRMGTDKFGYVAAGSLSPVPSKEKPYAVAGACTGPMDTSRAVAAAHAAASTIGSRCGLPPDPGNRAAEPESPSDAAGTETGPTIVCLCEYGLKAKGVDPVVSVEAAQEIDGVVRAASFRLACAPGPVADLGRLVSEEGPLRLIVVGCHTPSHAEFWRSRVSTLGESLIDVRLVDVPDGSGEGAAADAVRAQVAGGAGVATDRSIRGTADGVLVIGGGLAGLAAADEAAQRGVSVTLVAAHDALGGESRARLLPDEALCEALDGLIERVTSSALIDVHLDSSVAVSERSNGAFSATIKGRDGERSLAFGAVVVAGEDQDYDPSDWAGRDAGGVLTQAEFAEHLCEGPPSAHEIVVIQCVGSRTPEWPICSRRCCAEAMVNVLRFKAQKPEALITVLHKGIRVWGPDEEMFSDAIDAGVKFVRVEDPPVISANGKLEVSATDADCGETLTLSPDAVVLSVGVRPSECSANAAQALGVGVDHYGFLLPRDEALAPVESGRIGVFVCGSAVAPTIGAEGGVQGRAAAGKACLFMKGSVR